VGGFIKLHKQILKWEWYDDSNTFRLFIHCMLNASYEDNYWQGELIKKGSFVSGRKKLAKELKLTEQQIRTSINKLKKSEEITIVTTNKYSIITVINYTEFQEFKKNITNKQPTNNQQTTNKNEKINQEKKCLKANKTAVSSVDKNINNQQEIIYKTTNVKKVTTTKELKNIKDKEQVLFSGEEKKVELSKIYLDMANYMFAKIKELNPNNKKPNIIKWGNDFRKMVEIDKREPKEIGKLINWIYKDDFWYSVILSPKKLRDKYDTLIIKARGNKNFKTVEESVKDYEEMRKYKWLKN